MKERKNVFKKSFLLYKEHVIHFKKICSKKESVITFSFVCNGKNCLYRYKKNLIGKKGQFLLSLFLPLSALCALSTPLSFSERNGPTIEILLIIEETS